MTGERLRIWGGVALISVVWGSTWLAIKIGLSSVPPLLGVGIRFLAASAILLAILRMRKIPAGFTGEARILYAPLPLLTFGIPFALVYWAEQHIASGLASVLFAAFPFWVALFSQLLLPAERLNAWKIAGILIGFAGVVIIFAEDLSLEDDRGVLAMVALVLSTALQAFSTVLVSRYGRAVHPVTLNWVGMSIAGVLLTAAGAALESPAAIVWDAAAVGSILYLAVFGSVAAFATYYWLLKRIEAVYLSLTSFVNPIIAVILGAIILEERLAPTILLGAGFVLIGILTANGRALAQTVRGGRS